MGGAVCGGNPTSDCPYPDPAVTAARGHGVNYLFSAEHFNGPWRAEHSLLNTSSFVSCPEFFKLQGMAKNQYVYHEMGSPNAFGSFDTASMIFKPDKTGIGRYDNGDGHASKSYWDDQTRRRIMWSWISGRFPCSNPDGFECDSMQSVPREMKYSPELETLLITPIAEVAKLREKILAVRSIAALTRSPSVIDGASGAALDILANFTCHANACDAAIRARVSTNLSEYVEIGFDCRNGITPRNYSIMEDTNIRAGDNVGEDFRLEGPAASDHVAAEICITACEKHEDCEAWTFVRPVDGRGERYGRCALKGAKHKNAVPDSGCISGFMPGFEPKIPTKQTGGDCEVTVAGVGGEGQQQTGGGSFSVPFNERSPFDGSFQLRVLVDTSVVEVYAGDVKAPGRAIYTMMYMPSDPSHTDVAVIGDASVGVSLEVHAMGSAYA